jgi:putative ABC transport system substrate-binding protein
MTPFLALILGFIAAVTGGVPASAQAGVPARVGLLSSHSAERETESKIGATAFRAGMKALGYVEPLNLVIEERHANGDRDRLRSHAAELVNARVQVIVTIGTDATQAARDITSSVPIVMAGVGDPVRAGLVASLAHPSGNITGTAIFSPEAARKADRDAEGGGPAHP